MPAKTKEPGVEFERYLAEIDASIERAQEKIKREKSRRQYVKRETYPAWLLRSELKETLGVDFFETELVSPPEHVAGDFSLETYALAKKTNQAPLQLAKEIAEKLNAQKSGLIEQAFPVGPFVNIETNKAKLYQLVIEGILSLGEQYGESDLGAGQVALFDYSAPNIAKPIGVGHLRSTIIGQALLNIYHATGFSVIGDNHLGDWGTQFGKLIYAYQNWGDEKAIIKNPIEELKNLYVRFNQEAREKPELNDAAREIFLRLEQGDPDLLAVWKRFRDLSLLDFQRVYQKLGIEFDTYIGESYFQSEVEKLVEECLTQKFCRVDKESGAVVVDEIAGLPSFLLRKKDGTSLYLTRDLATLKFRIKTFRPQTLLYVVGNEQELNFRQLFAFARQVGIVSFETELKHIGFGMVLRDGKKMSTREGTLIELEELLSQSIKKAREILSEKNSSATEVELEEIGEIIGVGAIIYNDLRQSRTKNISFDWKRMLDLEGGSAVYLQYSYVRIRSILRKLSQTHARGDSASQAEKKYFFETESEFKLAKKLMLFPEIIIKATRTDSPHHICGYLEELALLFNSFYAETSLLKTSEAALRDSRVALCQSVAIVLKKGLGLLGIRVPEKM